MLFESILRSQAHRIKLIRQGEASECGLACVAMLAAYHGLKVDLGSLRRLFRITSRGLNLRHLMEIASSLGLISRPLKLEVSDFPRLALPAILHWNMSHFVVVERLTRTGILIHDPINGMSEIDLKEASRAFTGIALEVMPAPEFARADLRVKFRLSDLWGSISGWKRSAAQVIVLAFLGQFLLLIIPYFMQLAVDMVLPTADKSLLTSLSVAFIFVVVLMVTTSWLRAKLLSYLSSSSALQISTNVLRKLLRLPVDYFLRREAGDILSRLDSVQSIRNTLGSAVATAIVDGVFAGVTFALMFVYSPLLGTITGASVITYLLTRRAIVSRQHSAKEQLITLKARELSSMLELIRGMVTIRMFSKEAERLALVQNRLLETTHTHYLVEKLEAAVSNSKLLILGIENIVCVGIAVGMVIDAKFSMGMLLAFLAYKQQFTERTVTFIDQLAALKLMNLDIERIAEVAREPDDPSCDQLSLTECSVRGDLTVENVHFRYGRLEAPVLNGLNLSVRAGEHVAITGASGGGKSTLLKVMLGLVEPEEGCVKIDGVQIGRLGYKIYRQQVSAVLQEDFLFTASVADNIALFDTDYQMDNVEKVARMAAIHEDIMSLPMQYQTPISDLASTLSGGQRQRLLLARALYRNPRVLFLDEATSHLDAKTENLVSGEIANLGITRIVIAHRAETIRRADRVLVLEGGKLFETCISGAIPIDITAEA